MRPYLTLIFAAVFMAFVAGYFALYLKGSYRPSESDLQNIMLIKDEFQNKIAPNRVFNLDNHYPGRDRIKLLDPKMNPEAGNLKKSIYSSDKDCFFNISTFIQALKGPKPRLWEEFRCGLRGSLPKHFFKAPPYLHESGYSYAFLAYKLGTAPFNEEAWIKSKIGFFHITELKRLKFFKFLKPFEIFRTLDDESLSSLAEGKSTILSKKYLLARNSLFFTNALEYRVYLISDLKKFLKKSDFTLRPYQAGRDCFLIDGEMCWEYSLLHKLEMTNKTTIIFFVSSILIIVLVIWLLYTKIKGQRMEEERKKLALQVLTHEFRTPIASLILQVEEIKKAFSDFTPNIQESFLRLAGDVHRLQRLTETSRNYLKLNKRQKLVDCKFFRVPSFNDFISMQLENYKDEVEFIPLTEDIGFCLDTYWVGIALKNLLENALAHGEKPVQVTLVKGPKNVKVTIADSGTCQFQSIGEMKTEFVKGNKSSGTGLGLNIVFKIMKEMGGDLAFDKNPTRFTLIIPLKNKENS
ncbi:MAG: DUF3404 domain-containing protein [Deltaproteobacteria bacterium]|nr:MAG: DUF3404 domain-containing protein [Deltaproteobacteria bacterium]